MDERERQKKALATLLARTMNLPMFTTPLRQSQEDSNIDSGIPGNMWASKVDWPVETGPELKQVSPRKLSSHSGVGPRPGFSRKDKPPAVSPAEAYQNISKEAQNPTTILFLFGGAFVRGSAALSRPVTSTLASLSGGRVFALNYRLSPQHPFPAPVLDLLIAYFTLLHPPPGATHSPVDPSHIVLAGESAGAILGAALIQCLLHIRRQNPQNPTVTFNGRQVPVALPAGLAVLSPAFDIGLSLPSFERNNDRDWIWGADPRIRSNFPADDVWPSDPPRVMPYCHDSALAHPMLNTTAVALEDLKGFPPVWIAAGKAETLVDGTMVVAKDVALAGGEVELVLYEGMPHIFPLIMREMPQTQDCMRRWAEACRNMAKRSADASQPRVFENKATIIELGELKERIVDVTKTTDLDVAEVRKRLWLRRVTREGFVWVGPKKHVPFLGRL
ncbi:MAG: hypothetical protein Q9159_003362 [Coniocarpon cinnabarinum]